MDKDFFRRHRFEIVLFLVYLLLALVFTYPLILHPTISIYGLRGDHLFQLWESWWRKNALLQGKSLMSTDLIYAPAGYNFSNQPLQPLPLFLNLVLTILTNEVVALNLLLILSFPLSGMAVYWLVKDLTDNRLASAFSGLVYSFSMYHFSHAWEHSSLISIYWMPLFVWSLVRFDRLKNLKSALVAALLFTLVLLDNFYYGFMMVFFAVSFVIVRSLQGFLVSQSSYLDRRRALLLLAFVASVFVLTSPVVIPILRRSFEGSGMASWERQGSYERSLHDLNWFSARPWHYLLPSPHHPILGGYSQAILDWLATKPPYFLTQPYSGKEHNLYLGWAVLCLSAFAVVMMLKKRLGERGRWVALFAILGVIMMIFSAPPYATLSSHRINFPSNFLHAVFPMFRAYARFGVLVLLCISVLAGFGLAHLLEKIRHSGRRYLLVGLLSLMALAEVALPSFNVDLKPPEVYRWLKEQPGDFIVLEFPPRSDHTDVLYQRFHQKRLFDPVVENSQDILYASEKQISHQALLLRGVREDPSAVAELGVKYIIFHENDPLLSGSVDYFNIEPFRIVRQFSGTSVYEIIKSDETH